MRRWWTRILSPLLKMVAVSGGRPGVRSMFLSIGGNLGVLGSSHIGVVLCRWGNSRSTGIAAEKNVLMVSCDFP
jgi:hypothetical protein